MVAIFLIATALVFLGMDYIVQRKRKRAESGAAARSENAPAQIVPERFLVPKGYFFNPGHAWAELLPSGNVRVGVDDFLRKIAGSFDGIHVLKQNSHVGRGEPVMVLKQGERMLTVAAPVEGDIVGVNEEVLRNPAILDSDPYAAGWILAMEPRNLNEDLRHLTLGSATADWLRKEVARFRDFIGHAAMQPQYARVGMTMADGGMPLTGALQHADGESWKKFESEFLAPQNSEASR